MRDALAARGIGAFLDERAIPPGSSFPQDLADALLQARVMLVFADATYFERPWCVYEFQVAVAPYRVLTTGLDHIVVALPTTHSVELVTPHLPPPLAQSSWPRADQTDTLADLVEKRLSTLTGTIGEHITGLDDAAVRTLRQGGAVPQAGSLSTCPGYLKDLPDTLMDRFVGRTEELWRIFHVLETRRAAGAPRACAIHGGGGIGKTQLVAEYVWRYGPKYYPGGLVWINADGDEATLLEQFRGVLQTFAPDAPPLADSERDNGRQLATLSDALVETFKTITHDRAVLWVIDNIPEPGQGAPARSFTHWCPPHRYVSVLCTSRRAGIKGVDVALQIEELPTSAAIELLTLPEVKRAWLPDDDWEAIAKWVGSLPLALRILQTSLSDGFVSARDLLAKARGTEPAAALDAEVAALRDEIDEGYLRGVAEAFRLSYAFLEANQAARQAAHLLARLAPMPIHEDLLTHLVPQALLGRLAKRSWVQVAEGAQDAGQARRWRMHRIVASYLRCRSPDPDTEFVALIEWLWDLHKRGLPWSLLVTAGPHIYVIFDSLIRWYYEQTTHDVKAVARAREFGLWLATWQLADFERRGFRYIAANLIEALGQDEELVDRLAAAYHSGDTAIAKGVAGMLHGMPYSQAAAELCVAMLKDTRFEVRWQAMINAPSFQVSEVLAVPLLDAIMSEENENLRQNAIAGYEHLVRPRSQGLRNALSQLFFYLNEGNVAQRQTAVEILGRLLREYGENVAAGGFTSTHVRQGLLHLALNDPEEEVATRAAQMLGTIADAEAYTALVARLRDASVGLDRQQAIGRLGWYLRAVDQPALPRVETRVEDGQHTFRINFGEPKPRRPELFQPLVQVVTAETDAAAVESAVQAIVAADTGKLALVDAMLALLDAEEYTRVIDISNTVARLAPDFSSAFWWRGQAHDALGKLDEAIADYGRVVASSPQFAEAFYNRARLLRQKGDINLAIQDLDAAITLDPNDPRTYWERGQLYEELNQHQAAIADYSRVITLTPDFAEAFYYRAALLSMTGDTAAAVRDYDAMIALKPTDWRPRYNRAVLRYQMSEYAVAIQDLDRVITLQPDDWMAYHLKTVCLMNLGRFGEAVQAATGAIERNESIAECWYFRALAREQLGDGANALVDAEHACALDATDTRFAELRERLHGSAAA